MNYKTSKTSMGCAEVDITPKNPVTMVGFDRSDQTSVGVLDGLAAQVFLWEKDGERLCLISVDSIGLTVEITTWLRSELSQSSGIPAERIMVCFTHTHSAPDGLFEREYVDFLLSSLTDGVSRAVADLSPVHAGWGVAYGDIGLNRRGDAECLDRRVGVLKVVDESSGDVKALLLRCTAHANVLVGDNRKISSDYVGFARERLKKRYGCPVMITQGASGDVRPRFRNSMGERLEIYSREAESLGEDILKGLEEENVEALEKMADEIERAVGDVMSGIVVRPVSRLRMLSEMKDFRFEIPSKVRAEDIAKEALDICGIDGSSWLAEVAGLREAGMTEGRVNMEIQYFLLDEGCICGVPEEAMCGIALDIAERAGSELVFFGGYTNGCRGYLPTAAEFDRGGFEVLWSYLLFFRCHRRVMPLVRESADELVSTVSDRLMVVYS
ncbi:hypothetical protein L2W58_06030 [Dethiosulfovibrio sp. F2B]|uniref:hypothetical protein n=1 Tax=Dethiosulfovibrio faecalis TaxID=2720018 RepID=UPI001F36CEE7|nr:hypothetical protein [Dethiosulfovibrio faecalis]MCF4151357.1 hypothetical protein [Dethiosulfovibrio faecalis]